MTLFDFDRAFGIMLGQCAGDALGAQVEFMDAASIASKFPDGVRDMVGGGPWKLRRGQITDDSELALALARSIVREGRFDLDAVAAAYIEWANSDPFDIGATCSNALCGQFDDRLPLAAQCHLRALDRKDSQANGALMRISPLALHVYKRDAHDIAAAAEMDAALTHVNRLCQKANGAYVVALCALLNGGSALDAYRAALDLALAESIMGNSEILKILMQARSEPPGPAHVQMGWFKHGFHAAFYHLLHAPSFEEGVVRTIALGGDTDTNAAIVGAMLGARFGAHGIPASYHDAVLGCNSPRPADYQTRDLETLTRDLLLTATGYR